MQKVDTLSVPDDPDAGGPIGHLTIGELAKVRDVKVGEIKEVIERPRRVVLEIGAGGSGSPYLNDANIRHYSNAYLIRVDLRQGDEDEVQIRDLTERFGGAGESGSLLQAKERDRQRIGDLDGRFTGKIDYIKCDATHMPYEDETVDEIYMANVFSSPCFRTQNRAGILQEIKRVLRRDGILILVETYTPECALKSVYRDCSRKSFQNAINTYIRELIGSSGLLLETVEFPEYSASADQARDEGRNCDKFLSKYPYGKRMVGDDFIPRPPAPYPDYKFIIVLTKKC